MRPGVRGKPFPEVSWTKDKDATDLTRSHAVRLTPAVIRLNFLSLNDEVMVVMRNYSN